jgi:hypothetical protein
LAFDVDDPSAVENLTLRMKYDDAFVAYINGTEVARANFEGDPTFDAQSTRTARRPTEFEDFLISEHIGLLNPGENVLAIHGMNRSISDRDMLILPTLIDGIIANTEIAGIPHAQEGNPTIRFDDASFEANPASGNQDEEYIKLDNPNDVAVDVSGWRLTGGIEHTFKPGTVIPSGDSIYVTPNVRVFRARSSGPSGGQGLFVQGNYQGHLSSFGETIQLLAEDGTPIDTLVTTPDTSPAQRFLRITEVHYNPAGLDDSTEFIEVQNVSSGADATTLDLTGVTLSDGPSDPFGFEDGTSLGPGEFLLIVKDPAAFQAAYPSVDAARIAGAFKGGLNNQGERIKLDDATGSTIAEFTYADSDPWPDRADGAGASLVLIDPVATPLDQLDKHYRWRGSSQWGGSPGAESPEPMGVVINEVVSNAGPDNADGDAIELLNTTEATIDLSGWYLSDSADDLLKFRIPDNTSLAPGQFLVFTEANFNPNPQNPGPKDFGLSGTTGDDVWLVIPDGQGGVSTMVDDVHFAAAAVGESFGRYPDAAGRLTPMAAVTLGQPNSQPRVGPLVVSELHYHPDVPSPAALLLDPDLTPDDLEFVEIHNPTGTPVDLTGWRIRGGIDFDFPDGLPLPPGQSQTIISFNPVGEANIRRVAAFRAHYGIDETVSLVGGYQGQLSDGGEPVRLLRPGTPPPDDATVLPRLVEDEVLYDDLAPWPVAADGSGQSLTRSVADGWGNAAGSWAAAVPSLGTAKLDTSLPGDSNDDGVFNQEDLQQAMEAGKYLSGQPATRAEGDWNGDGVFDQLDIVAALQTGQYVPEVLAALLALDFNAGGASSRFAPLAAPSDPPQPVVDDYFAMLLPGG